jgi:hypothetical protein
MIAPPASSSGMSCRGSRTLRKSVARFVKVECKTSAAEGSAPTNRIGLIEVNTALATTANLRRITREAFNERDDCAHRYHRRVCHFRRRLAVGGSPHTPPEAIVDLTAASVQPHVFRHGLLLQSDWITGTCTTGKRRILTATPQSRLCEPCFADGGIHFRSRASSGLLVDGAVT